MRTPCGIILATVIALAAVAAAAPLAEYLGEVGEKTGWKCVGSEEGKVVYIPFEGYYESKGGRAGLGPYDCALRCHLPFWQTAELVQTRRSP